MGLQGEYIYLNKTILFENDVTNIIFIYYKYNAGFFKRDDFYKENHLRFTSFQIRIKILISNYTYKNSERFYHLMFSIYFFLHISKFKHLSYMVSTLFILSNILKYENGY